MIESSGQRAALRRRRSTDVVLLKDLAPRKDVRGGRATHLFGERDDGRRPVTSKKGSKGKGSSGIILQKRPT